MCCTPACPCCGLLRAYTCRAPGCLEFRSGLRESGRRRKWRGHGHATSVLFPACAMSGQSPPLARLVSACLHMPAQRTACPRVACVAAPCGAHPTPAGHVCPYSARACLQHRRGPRTRCSRAGGAPWRRPGPGQRHHDGVGGCRVTPSGHQHAWGGARRGCRQAGHLLPARRHGRCVRQRPKACNKRVCVRAHGCVCGNCTGLLCRGAAELHVWAQGHALRCGALWELCGPSIG